MARALPATHARRRSPSVRRARSTPARRANRAARWQAASRFDTSRRLRQPTIDRRCLRRQSKAQTRKAVQSSAFVYRQRTIMHCDAPACRYRSSTLLLPLKVASASSFASPQSGARKPPGGCASGPGAWRWCRRIVRWISLRTANRSVRGCRSQNRTKP